LDATSDTLRKEYIEVKEKLRLPNEKYMPILIFGEYKNGAIQITRYESPMYYHDKDFQPFVDDNDDIVVFRSIGTPYFNLKNLDSIDMIYYNEYLEPHTKYKVKTAGKNYNKLLQRLTQNRTPIKVTSIKNKFAAFGSIRNIRPATGFNQANFYELNITIKNLIKNEAKMGQNIAIFINKDRLPPVGSCQPLDYYPNSKIDFYFLGDLKGYVLVKASCGQGWLEKSSVEDSNAKPYVIDRSNVFAPGPCGIL